MSQVLRYGVPVKEGLLCDNPACKELATNIITYKGTAATEHFVCSEHVAGLVQGRHIDRHTRLLVPGEHNPKDDNNGQESQKA